MRSRINQPLSGWNSGTRARQNDRAQNHWLAIQSGAWRIGRLCGIIDGDFKRWPQFRATMKSILSGRCVDDSRVRDPSTPAWKKVVGDRAQPTVPALDNGFLSRSLDTSLSRVLNAWLMPAHFTPLPSFQTHPLPSPPSFLWTLRPIRPSLQDRNPTFFTDLLSRRLY